MAALLSGAVISSIAVGLDRYKGRAARKRAKLAAEQEFLAREERFWTSRKQAAEMDAEFRRALTYADGWLGADVSDSDGEENDVPPAYVPPDMPAYDYDNQSGGDPGQAGPARDCTADDQGTGSRARDKNRASTARSSEWPYAHGCRLMRDENGELNCACLDCIALRNLRKTKLTAKAKRRVTS